jgi:hypothetical protein
MNRIQRLKEILKFSRKDHKLEIMNQKTIKDAHTYCKMHKLSGQIYGPLLEHYIIDKQGMTKNSSSLCIGDCCILDRNIEIKISLGGDKTHKDFNYVQIRPNHTIDYYILTAYYLDEINVVDEGELFMFLIHQTDMKKLLIRYGKYAHGTRVSNGAITNEDIYSSLNGKEYALRPKYNDPCWKALLTFRVENLIIP